MPVLTYKRCRTCLEEKPSTEFYASKSGDGREPHCKECRKARFRERYASDPDYRASTYARTRQYHLDHPEWSAERLRASHVRNSVERYERYKQRGKDPAIQASRRSATRRSESRRRALVAGALDAESISDRQLQELLTEHGHRCYICDDRFDGEYVVLHWDHYKPLANGGTHSVDNLVPACADCNVRKNAVWPFTTVRLMEIKNQVLTLRGIERRRREVGDRT